MSDFIEPKELVAMQLVPDSSTAIYTGDATRKTKITQATITEQAGAGTVTLQLWLVPDAGSTSNDNRLYNTQSISSNAVDFLDKLEGKILSAGTDIYAQASAANELSIQITGTVFEDPS